MFKVGDVVISQVTVPLHFTTKHAGRSKVVDWVAAGVPCIVEKVESTTIYIDPFTSSRPTNLHVVDSHNIVNFIKCEVEDGYILGLAMYPGGKLLKEEFDKRKDVKNLMKKIKYFSRGLEADNICKKIITDKLSQIEATQGAPCMTVEKIMELDIEGARAEPTKRFDNMIFNRCSRQAPPIPDTYSYEEYKKSRNFCKPIGTRPKDFCLPSEFTETCIEMIRQIACFKGIDPDTKQKLIKLVNIDDRDCLEYHQCKWCGEIIEAAEYTSGYSSKDNFIEICHRDPKDRFLKRNMYWGHGECNRQQGGYSEEERVNQIAKLLNIDIDLIPNHKFS